MKKLSAIANILTALGFILFTYSCKHETNSTSPEAEYAKTGQKLKSGWGTFNTDNVLSHVFLPDGMALNIGIKTHENYTDNFLNEALISRGYGSAQVTPGFKSFDGSYSELTVTWNGLKIKIESATTGEKDLLLLITPVSIRDSIPVVILQGGFLWNLPGKVESKGDHLVLKSKKKITTVRTTGTAVKEYLSVQVPYLSVKLDRPVAFYTGKNQTVGNISELVAAGRSLQDSIYSKYGALASVYQSLQSVIAWNIIYDAYNDRVICPVSRSWNRNFGGQYVLFDWDTYFSAMMASLECKELAYANAVGITKAITPGGFIPNFTCSYGNASFDRSQPPVGSLAFIELYKRFRDKWLLEYVYDDLLKWNRWWPKNRDCKGFLCWGSNPVELPLRSDSDADSWQGAAYESGLDNSPAFAGVPFNKKTHLMEQADAGLMGLYIMDCEALSEIAGILGKPDDLLELQKRAEYYRNNLKSLWDEKTGIYRNRRTDNGLFSPVLSPANFYPLLARAASQEQAERMVNEHLLNPDEFYGERMIPSVSRNNPEFKTQNYWKGRIWGPMNFLVYLGLRNYDLDSARKIIAEKSVRLLMENVRLNGYVYENYNAITGNVSDPEEGKRMGDCYYHWGALLGFIQLIEDGYWEPPE